MNISKVFTCLTIIVFVIGLATNFSLAQENITKYQLQNLNELSSVIGKRQVTETTGSAYLNTKFLKGHIFLNENTTSQPVFLRYNTQKNNIEFLRNKEVLVTDANKISGFEIYTNQENITFRNGFSTDIDEIKKATFLRIIYNGNVKLLAHHSSYLQKDLASYNTAVQKNKYRKVLTYYFVGKDGNFQEFELNKNDVISFMSDKSKKIKKYARENGLDFKSERDVASIIKYYDKL